MEHYVIHNHDGQCAIYHNGDYIGHHAVPDLLRHIAQLGRQATIFYVDHGCLLPLATIANGSITYGD